MKAILESLLVPEEATWTYFHRRLNDSIPFIWHYHREIELTLTVNSIGQRYVGDSIEAYEDGDLVLVGPDVPHTWMSQHKIDDSQPHVAHVFWIDPDWLANLIDTVVELQPIRTMLQSSGRGVAYSAAAVKAVRPLIENMGNMPAMRRVICLLEILAILAADRDCQLICAPGESVVAAPCARIQSTLDYIHQHYQQDISMNYLAELAALSVSGLHRLFKRHTRQTVGEYIAHLRIGKACSLLISTNRSVSWVSAESGYTNLSHFNRQFLAIKRTTPREFRRRFVDHGAFGQLASQENPYAITTKESRPVYSAMPAPETVNEVASSPG
jgi:AraC-like DNA-binding protein